MRRLLLSLAAAALLAAPAHAAAKPHARDCGLTPRIQGERFQVKVEQGRVRCTTARRVATKFARTDRMRPVRGWLCFRGHGTEPAASCSGPHGAVLRVYAPT
jgi:hypothetical protein